VIGKDLVREFGYRLLCHDAEDPENLAYLGTTRSGYDVEINRLVVDSDLTVYLNTVVWRVSTALKSICVGLSTYRSIAASFSRRHVHVHRGNQMHAMLDEMEI